LSSQIKVVILGRRALGTSMMAYLQDYDQLGQVAQSFFDDNFQLVAVAVRKFFEGKHR
jgi:hypothetical protein